MSAICTSCAEPLVILDEQDPTSPGLVDDVELLCGHHYHWSCFQEEYSSPDATPETKSRCPKCSAQVFTDGKLLVTLVNEGGVQRDFDLGTLLDEEEFYDRNPDMKKVRAFLEFCAEGDEDEVKAMLDMDETLINMQDFETKQTGLHVAVQNGRENIVKLLFERGADRHVVDARGRTPHQLAVELGASEEQLKLFLEGHSG